MFAGQQNQASPPLRQGAESVHSSRCKARCLSAEGFGPQETSAGLSVPITRPFLLLLIPGWEPSPDTGKHDWPLLSRTLAPSLPRPAFPLGLATCSRGKGLCILCLEPPCSELRGDLPFPDENQPRPRRSSNQRTEDRRRANQKVGAGQPPWAHLKSLTFLLHPAWIPIPFQTRWMLDSVQQLLEELL